MHIITGLIIAGLLREKQGAVATGFPVMKTGPLQTLHMLPGRIRFRAPSLIGDEVGEASLVKNLAGIDGIHSIRASHVTGTILLTFDETKVEPSMLFAATARILGLDEALKATPRPLLVEELKTMGGCINRAVYDNTNGMVDLWTALLLGLAAMGARRIYLDGIRSMPAGFTMLWWALMGLKGGRAE